MEILSIIIFLLVFLSFNYIELCRQEVLLISFLLKKSDKWKSNWTKQSEKIPMRHQIKIRQERKQKGGFWRTKKNLNGVKWLLNLSFILFFFLNQYTSKKKKLIYLSLNFDSIFKSRFIVLPLYIFFYTFYSLGTFFSYFFFTQTQDTQFSIQLIHLRLAFFFDSFQISMAIDFFSFLFSTLFLFSLFICFKKFP